MRTILVTLCLLAAAVQSPSEVAFTIADRELIPEGIAYDARTRTFFVGSTYKRKIVAIDAAGKTRDFTKEGQDGAFGFVGLRVDSARRALWAISSHAGAGMPGRGLDERCNGCSAVMRFDIPSGKLSKKYALTNTAARHFLNDLVVLPNGDVIITDTMTGDLYRITRVKDALERWVPLGPQVFPNGIDAAPDGRTLFVATEAGIRKVDAATGAVTPLKGARTPSIDGLCFFDGGLIAIQPFEEYRKLVRYTLDASRTAITRTDILEGEHPSFRQPTTGVVVGRDFVYIANAQLQAFRALVAAGSADRSSLAPVVVLRERLR